MELNRYLTQQKGRMYSVLATENILKNIRYVQGKLRMIEEIEEFLREDKK